jgi:two-component system, chemotaxis family, sensor kinase CheA
VSSDFDMTEIRQVFIQESLEGLDVMESGLLSLDVGAADPEVMNSIFRAAHSIKGGGATSPALPTTSKRCSTRCARASDR